MRLDGEDPRANAKFEVNRQCSTAGALEREISGTGFGNDSERKSDIELDTGGLLCQSVHINRGDAAAPKHTDFACA